MQVPLPDPISIWNAPLGRLLGCESEMWVLDVETGQIVNFDSVIPGGSDYACAIKFASPELFQSMIEAQAGQPTDPELVDEVSYAIRWNLAANLMERGLFPVSTSTSLGMPEGGHLFTKTKRIQSYVESMGADLLQKIGAAGAHVHVTVPDRDLATQVTNRVRPWVNVLAALSVNSPIRHGVYSGMASQRMVLWPQIPSYSEQQPYWRSWEHYEAYAKAAIAKRPGEDVNDLTRSHDNVRPHSKHSTVEIRVNDVGLTVDHDLLGARLARALVVTVGKEIERGIAPRWQPDPHTFYPLARQLTARGGTHGLLLDPDTGRAAPARVVIAKFLAYLTPSLKELGTYERTMELASAVLGTKDEPGIGTGSDRQLIAWAAISRAREVRRLPITDRGAFLAGKATLSLDEQKTLAIFAGLQSVEGRLTGPSAERLIPGKLTPPSRTLVEHHPDDLGVLREAEAHLDWARSFLTESRVIGPNVASGRSTPDGNLALAAGSC